MAVFVNNQQVEDIDIDYAVSKMCENISRAMSMLYQTHPDLLAKKLEREERKKMKHLKNAQDKATDSGIYRYTVGFLLLLGEATKTVLLGIYNHITELLMVLSFIGMIVCYNAFEAGAINYTVTILFVLVLAILGVALVKVKILEGKKKK